MKTNNIFFLIALIAIISGISSCHNIFKDDDEDPGYEYLVDYEMTRSMLPQMIEALVVQYPGASEVLAEVRERIEYGIVVYSISYKTTFNGEEIVASGLVSVPMAEGPFPMISYQNGTNTLHGEAPSVSTELNLFRLLEAVASTGFVIVMPDYLGFGSTDNMFHPYLHAGSTVPVVLDMLRAVKELGEIRGFSLNNDLYLTGYSMGGWATLQVQKEIETKNLNEFNLKASAPGAGPYDLNFVNNSILEMETYPSPYFLGYVFDSYSNLEEINTPLDAVFNPPYDSLVSVLYNGTLSGEQINSQLTTDISELFTENFLTNRDTDTTYASISEALEANSVDAWRLSTKTTLIHSSGDELVPFQVSQKTYNDLIDAGTSPNMVELKEIQGLSHSDAVIPTGVFAINWFFEIQEQ